MHCRLAQGLDRASTTGLGAVYAGPHIEMPPPLLAFGEMLLLQLSSSLEKSASGWQKLPNN
jgi:hypothetical protein